MQRDCPHVEFLEGHSSAYVDGVDASRVEMRAVRWALGWTAGLAIAFVVLGAFEPRDRVGHLLVAVLVGVTAFAAPAYLNARPIDGRAARIEALAWLVLFVSLISVFSYQFGGSQLGKPGEINAVVLDPDRPRQHRAIRVPWEARFVAGSIALFGLAAGFASGIAATRRQPRAVVARRLFVRSAQGLAGISAGAFVWLVGTYLLAAMPDATGGPYLALAGGALAGGWCAGLLIEFERPGTGVTRP